MNYYDFFGISPTATPEDINSAHKSLAKKYHPDINSSKDAHEKMTMLNKAHEVLSDTTRRKEYDKELRQNQQQRSTRDTSSTKTNQPVKAPHEMRDTDERAGKAELLRRKAEARLKTEDAARSQRNEQAQQKAKDATQKSRQMRADIDKQHVVSVLSSLVMDGNAKQEKMMESDEERHYATKVLLSLVRKDNEHLRRRAEEVERKQRIEEILALVKEYNKEKTV